MPAHLDHPSFAQPDDPAIWLWRYMDLSKFAALLQRRALVFARADNLGDPFEGSVPQPNADALKYAKALRASDPARDPHKGMSDDMLEDMYKMTTSMRKSAVKAHFISCWHMNEAESAAMWKLYSKSSDAVCIRTEYRTLASVLSNDVYMGIIRYLDYNTTPVPANNTFNPFLIKRRSFAHEREARAIIVDLRGMQGTEMPAVKEVPIDVATLVNAIYVSPDSPDWFREVVADLSNKYGLAVPVQHSELNAVPLY